MKVSIKSVRTAFTSRNRASATRQPKHSNIPPLKGRRETTTKNLTTESVTISNMRERTTLSPLTILRRHSTLVVMFHSPPICNMLGAQNKPTAEQRLTSESDARNTSTSTNPGVTDSKRDSAIKVLIEPRENVASTVDPQVTRHQKAPIGSSAQNCTPFGMVRSSYAVTNMTPVTVWELHCTVTDMVPLRSDMEKHNATT
eukprot:6488841-Amphidinium_carterae.3